MGNVASTVYSLLTNAFEEFLISIFDILLFLGILFALTVAGWLIKFLVQLVFLKACRPPGGAGYVQLSKNV
ncbi:ORF2b [RtMc arterivirus]|uniref:ORF2b n=1 Tax=RtMc arterivirus TaxID=2847274 RepID=A0A2H4MWN5_9NIDO|nr:ORF2b [Rodent arterivirus]ATP66630.1 ORF2b [RtMc arterivirus]